MIMYSFAVIIHVCSYISVKYRAFTSTWSKIFSLARAITDNNFTLVVACGCSLKRLEFQITSN